MKWHLEVKVVRLPMTWVLASCCLVIGIVLHYCVHGILSANIVAVHESFSDRSPTNVVGVRKTDAALAELNLTRKVLFSKPVEHWKSISGILINIFALFSLFQLALLGLRRVNPKQHDQPALPQAPEKK